MLNWCLEKIKELPYSVTIRYIFYRATQERGLKKEDYNNFKKWTSRARHNFWNGWRPDTLVDETREIAIRGGGYNTPKEWFDSFKDRECIIDKRPKQNKIIIICFEAEAMKKQFNYYTSGYYVSTVPFKGDHTIEPKWRLAKWIEQLSETYNKPVKILYFGDLDDKGRKIPESAFRDIRTWCSVPFEYERIGLNPEHVEKWSIPENPEKPGYQWEALEDHAAGELIQTALNNNINLEAIKQDESIEGIATKKWREIIGKLEWNE